MSFLDQPDELIIEQLTQIPIEKLLSACQTNQRLASICRDPILWHLKLQTDFPGVDTQRVPDPRTLYFRLYYPIALEKLRVILVGVPWDLEDPMGHLANLSEIYIPEAYVSLLSLLRKPILGLHRLVIYYPVDFKYYHRVEYASDRGITPLEVLMSIHHFYQQPYTQENVNAIAEIMGETPYEIEETTKLIETLRSGTQLEGLIPYRDGLALEI